MNNCLRIFFLLLFVSCDNELHINDAWDDIPVIYAILNPGIQHDADGSGFSTTTPASNFNGDGDSQDDRNYNHYVRVQKSFLGSEAASNYADLHDSIYYNPNNLEVWVETIDDTGDPSVQITLELMDADTLAGLDIFKEEGLFSIDNHYLYRLPTFSPNVTDLCQGDDNCPEMPVNYKISVLNQLTGDTAFAETNIVEPLKLVKPLSTGSYSILNFVDLLSQVPFIEIYPSKNAKMYTISLRFNYMEQHRDDYLYDVQSGYNLPTTGIVYKYVEWNLGDELASYDQLNGIGNARITKFIYGNQFFEFLKTHISEQDVSNPEFYRYPLYSHWQDPIGDASGVYHRCIDLNITAVNSELYTYLTANAPNYGFNQERPEYNNIQNGIGHVSSRSILNMPNLRINPKTMNAISGGPITRKLNFACYSNSDDYEPDFGFSCEED